VSDAIVTRYSGLVKGVGGRTPAYMDGVYTYIPEINSGPVKIFPPYTETHIPLGLTRNAHIEPSIPLCPTRNAYIDPSLSTRNAYMCSSKIFLPYTETHYA